MTALSANSWLGEARGRIEIERSLAALLTVAIALAFVASQERLWHWFTLPVTVCGLLIGPDAVRWLRGKYDLYDPKGVVGALGYYFFFLTPLLFIAGGAGMSQAEALADWRPWVGYLALLNMAGLLFYFVGHKVGFYARSREIRQPFCQTMQTWRTGVRRTAVRWTIDVDRAWPWFLLLGSVALLAQVYVFYQSGGIAGIIQQAMTVQETGRMETTGLGMFKMARRAAPIIALIYMSLIRQKRNLPPATYATTYALIVAFAVAQFLLLGFGGSRSATVWSLFWLVGIFHQYWRPIDRRTLFLGLGVVISFMYLYGFYKNAGTQAVTTLTEGGSLSDLEEDTGRTFRGMLIGDLSRTDVQSYSLFKLKNSKYDLRWGKTYLSALSRSIPSWVWPNRPLDSEKVVAATELFKGPGEYIPGDLFRNSSKVFGLAGEAMLNFGVWSAPIPFALWGFLVGRYRRVLLTWHVTDVRRFLAPLITLLLFMTLFSDLENTISTFIGKGSYVILLILLISRRSDVHAGLVQETPA